MTAEFKMDASEDSRTLDVIYLHDDVSYQQLCPEDILRLRDLEDQVRMMADEGGELCFTELVRQAQELETCFRAVVERLKIKKERR